MSETYRVAVGDNRLFGELRVVTVDADSDIEAAFQAGIKVATDHGDAAATWSVRGVISASDEQAEQAHEAAEHLAQQRHDEMVDSMYADGLIN